MDKDKQGVVRVAETDKSPRKSPRLEPQPDVASPEEAAGSDTSSGGGDCKHFRANGEEMQLLLAKIESLNYGPAPPCEFCSLESSGGSAAGTSQKDPHKQQLIMVCTQCDRCLCSGAATMEDKPWGHAGMHAYKKEHWVAMWLDKPSSGYCFYCTHGVYMNMIDGESDMESFGGSDEILLSPSSGSESDTDDHGYVIRGIPNQGNTCYLNALVQCLLVLDKLRIKMLGPDAPAGSIGMALKELFLETRARKDSGMLLRPEKLLESICAFDSQYRGVSMHDSQELLLNMRIGLNKEEELKRSPDMPEGVLTVVDSIFCGQLSSTYTCKSCQLSSVAHDPFYELLLSLPSKDKPLPSKDKEHPTKDVPTRQRSRKSRAKRSAVKQLFPAIECDSEEVQTAANGGDSHIPGTELEPVAIEKAHEPLKIDSTEAEQIHRKKTVGQGPVQSQQDDISCSELLPDIIDVLPIRSVAMLPDSLFTVKVEEKLHKAKADSHSTEDSPVRVKNASDVEQEDNAGVVYQSNKPEVNIQAERKQVTTEDKGKILSSDLVCDEKVTDSNTLASIKDCLAFFFKKEVVERRCENCSKVPEQPSTTTSKDGGQMVASTDEIASVDRDQIEQQSDRKYGDSDSQLQVLHTVDASCSTANEESDHDAKAEKTIDPQESQNTSIVDQDQSKQIDPNSAHQVGENKNEQEDRKGHADKTVVISKLPPVLTVHVKRFDWVNDMDKRVKITGHVSFEENLDVTSFMDHSSVEKDNCTYRLVGVVEHIGAEVNIGHYVAYVRPSRIGNQQSSGSTSWIRADDGVITEVSLERVLKCEAYLLFYERMEG
ncbi:hypothetical protein ACP4OV_018333 [Aristida adscensionis]